MTDDFKIKNPEVQARLKELGVYLKTQMPEGMGFTLLMSDFGEDGATFYISSVERDGALDSMKEFLIRQGKIPQDGAVLSPFAEPREKPVSGLPPSVDKLREAGVVLIKAAVGMNAPMIRVQIGGFIAFGMEDGEWEVIAKKISHA